MKKHLLWGMSILCAGIIGYTIFSLYRILISFAPDFQVYYTAADYLFSNKSLYNNFHAFTNFGYPPISAALYLPLFFLPYQIAQGIFVVTSFFAGIGALIFTFYLSKVSLKPLYIIIGIGLLCLFFPFKFTLGMGQSNAIAYFSLLLGVVSLPKNRIIDSAFFFALAFVAKPILLITIVWVLVTKQWKLLMAIIGILFVASVMMFGIFPFTRNDTMYYIFHELPQLFSLHGKAIYYNQGVAGFVTRTLGEWWGNVFVIDVIGVGILALVFKALSIKKDPVMRLTFIFAVLPLLDSLSWQHHFIFLLLPFVNAINIAWKEKDKLSLVFIGISYLLIGGNIAHPERFAVLPANIVLSHTFYGGVILFGVLLKQTGIISFPKLLRQALFHHK